jgi:aminopeptidase N
MSVNCFVYSLVAHGNTPLAEFSLVEGGNFKTQAGRILEEVDPKDPHGHFEAGAHQFDTLTEPDRTVYLCLSLASVSTAHRQAFLTELKQKWRAKYGTTSSTMSAYEKSADFASDFQRLFTTLNSERAQKTAQIKDNLQKAQDESAQNLTKALCLGEELTTMSDKADRIKDSATAFGREAGDTRRKMLWQKIRWWLLGGLVATVIIVIVVMLACGGPSFSDCKSSD